MNQTPSIWYVSNPMAEGWSIGVPWKSLWCWLIKLRRFGVGGWANGGGEELKHPSRLQKYICHYRIEKFHFMRYDSLNKKIENHLSVARHTGFQERNRRQRGFKSHSYHRFFFESEPDISFETPCTIWIESVHFFSTVPSVIWIYTFCKQSIFYFLLFFFLHSFNLLFNFAHSFLWTLSISHQLK